MKILYVCLGNICRSPLAEGILRHKAEQKSLDIVVDSAGTSDYHIGKAPDSRGISVAFDNYIDISHQRGRQFNIQDFDKFDYIIAMDKANYSHLLDMARNTKDEKKIKLFMNLAYPEKNMDVHDPYYDGRFVEVFALLNEASDNIIENLSEFTNNNL